MRSHALVRADSSGISRPPGRSECLACRDRDIAACVSDRPSNTGCPVPRNSTHLRSRRNYRTAHSRSSCSNARSRRSIRMNRSRRELGRHTTDNKCTHSNYCTVHNPNKFHPCGRYTRSARNSCTRSSSGTARSCCNLGPRALPRNARRCILGQLLLAWYYLSLR